MALKRFFARIFAYFFVRKIYKAVSRPVEVQDKVLKKLIETGRNTAFGYDHKFSSIKSYDDFKQQVPVKDYEALSPYIDRIAKGEANVLWKGKPVYLCKTSGTTSGVKYIPLTKESIPTHVRSIRNALFCYIAETGNTKFLKGKMIFIQGSPKLEKEGSISVGRLSGISAHHVPSYLKRNNMPSYEVNCIDDWESKIAAITGETINENMALIAGIPPWVQMYFDKLLKVSGKKYIKDVFPDFSLYIYGGVNFAPYRETFEKTIGKKIDSIETYPASEGFIAYQDRQNAEGLLLNIDAGIFYEFIPADEYFNENPTRISLKDVTVGVNYAIILNTNAGLWGYSIGDTVKFVSTDPYRLVVSGRIKHFTSAFGEHVISEEVEKALAQATSETNTEITDFTVAPQITPSKGLPYHEWFIEFSKDPDDLKDFAQTLDEKMQEQNIYYKDLITGSILKPLVITPIRKDGLISFMKSRGKLGGQNKLPRLSNDRIIADELVKFADTEEIFNQSR
ncbi:MAG: GH3 auxin-responsive promoter family protein [Balneolales bacterium]